MSAEVYETTWDKVKGVCRWLPIISTIGMGIDTLAGKCFGGSKLREVIFWICAVIVVLGWIAALLAGPIQLIKRIWAPGATAFSFGMGIPFVPANIICGALFWAVVFVFTL